MCIIFYTEAVTEELVSVMAENDKICNYIDMPIQHINNKSAQKNGAEQTVMRLSKKISMIRKYMPERYNTYIDNCGISGETDEEFEELYDFIKEIRFDRMGVFTYSQEEDTPGKRILRIGSMRT